MLAQAQAAPTRRAALEHPVRLAKSVIQIVELAAGHLAQTFEVRILVSREKAETALPKLSPAGLPFGHLFHRTTADQAELVAMKDLEQIVATTRRLFGPQTQRQSLESQLVTGVKLPQTPHQVRQGDVQSVGQLEQSRIGMKFLT